MGDMDIDGRIWEKLLAERPEVRAAIERRTMDEVHDCVIPRCGQRATQAFIADGRSRLAGRDWTPGEFIDLCSPHAHDVLRAFLEGL